MSSMFSWNSHADLAAAVSHMSLLCMTSVSHVAVHRLRSQGAGSSTRLKVVALHREIAASGRSEIHVCKRQAHAEFAVFILLVLVVSSIKVFLAEYYEWSYWYQCRVYY